MRVWHFSEMPYPHLPDPSTYESVRITLPSSVYDPQIGADLLNRYLDEWMIADDLGFDIMTNEHHASPTCMDVACPLTLAILARETKHARLLALGNPIANRREPVRLAEEMAWIDNVSRGRLECGFVRGVPPELAPANSNPVGMSERMWEAHDLILKAWTTHDGPFSWEGRYFQYRLVNVWPRPYQQPHPPIWITASSPSSAKTIAEHNYVIACFLTGYEGAKALFDAYRSAYPSPGANGSTVVSAGADIPADRFAYLALGYVGETDELGMQGARQLMWYVQTNKTAPQFTNPPGYASVADNVKAMRGGLTRSAAARSLTVEQLIERGIVFAGNPDTVYQQIKTFNDRVGGLGHLIIMGQAGFLSHEDTVSNLTLFSKEVYPRLKELN